MIPDSEWYADIHRAAEAIGPKVCGIYLFTHRETGCVYVGQAKDVMQRIKQHCCAARHPNLKTSAWHKALLAAGGVAAFDVTVLEVLPLNPAILTERENHWLKFYGAGDSIKCYNTHPVAGLSPLGRPQPAVIGLRVSKKLKGIVRSPEVRARISATKLTPEGRARNSAANKGRKHTPEALAKYRAVCNTPEYREKMRALKKGTRPSAACFAAGRTPETRAKLSAARKGRPIPMEQREKIRASMLGVKHTEERKKNISLAKKLFFASNKSAWLGRKHRPESVEKMRATRAANRAKRAA